MLKNYFKIAIRNLIRNKTFSAINIIGLSISMAICLLVIKMIFSIYSSDRFTEDGNRIFRIISKTETFPYESNELATTSAQFKEEMADSEDIEEFVRFWGNFYDFGKVDENAVPVSGYFADNNFFELFDFELKYGNPSSVLDDPFSIVLTEEMSKILFQDRSPIGETIHFKDYGNFKVTGIIRDLKYKSHMTFSCIASATSLSSIEALVDFNTSIEKWDDIFITYAFVKLTDTNQKERVRSQLNSIYNATFKDDKTKRSFDLQPLYKISPGKRLANSMGRIHDTAEPVLLSLIGFILILTASFTYNNLSIAKSFSRAKEVGIRKINGAKRKQIFIQFISEAIILALISLNFAYLILYFVEPILKRIDPGMQEYFTGISGPILFFAFLVFSLILGIVAGVFPAWYISKFNPSVIVSGMKFGNKRSKFNVKKMVIIFQFFISLMLTFSIIVLYKQFQFQQSVHMGFNPENIINVKLETVDYDFFKSKISEHIDVEDVSGVNYLAGLGRASKTWMHTENSNDSMITTFMFQSSNYLKNLDIKLVAGQHFDDSPGVIDNRIIINEKMSSFLGYENPIDAIGHTISIDEYGFREIIAITENFVLQNTESEPEPMAICLRPGSYKLANIRLSPKTDPSGFITYLNKSWKEIEPFIPLTHSFYTDEIEGENASLKIVLKVFGVITGIIILIAVMGLLGIVMYDVETRIKEIGIRKVMGANIIRVVWTVSKEFFFMIFIAAVIATPLSWQLNKMFLSELYRRVDQQFWWFLFGTLVFLLIGAVTIISQTMKAGLKNPVDTLRSE